MAQVHNELRRGREVARAIVDALGGTDSDVSIERVGETITPSIDIWSCTQPEWCLLRDERIFCGHQFAGAVVGELPAVGIVNPVGSNQLCVIEKVYARSGTVQNIDTGWGSAAGIGATLTLVSNAFFSRDARNSPQPATPGQGITPLQGAVGTDVAFAGIALTALEQLALEVAAADRELKMLPVVLPPGLGFVLVGRVANSTLDANIAGRVRLAFPGELG